MSAPSIVQTRRRGAPWKSIVPAEKARKRFAVAVASAPALLGAGPAVPGEGSPPADAAVLMAARHLEPITGISMEL